MAVALQDRFSKIVDAKLRYSLVQRDGAIWNKKYEGDPKAGAVKVPVRDTEVAVGQYNKQTGAQKTFAAGSYLTVTIDKDYAVNEVIDGYEADAVPDNLVADRLDSAGYALALQMNSDGTKELVDAGTADANTTALTKTTVYDAFVDARKYLSKKKVPLAGRFALVTPEVFALLLKSPEFIKASALGDAVVQTGAVGSIAGFTIYEDATLSDVKKAVGEEGSQTQNTVEFVCGHPDWCCRIDEWQKDVHLQSLDGSGTFIGASAVQGRKIYAHKVTKGETVLVKTAA